MLRRSARASLPTMTSLVRSNSSASSIASDDVDHKSNKRKRSEPKDRKKRRIKMETGGGQGDIEDLRPPGNWQLQFEALREFRRNGRPAAVDTMGCDIHEHIDPKTKRLHCLISLMLSAQCKDEYNALVMATLKQTLPRGLTLEDLLEIDQEQLAILIRPCGLHNNKAKYIKKTALVLRDEFEGDIPDSAEAMIRSLPGVGAKMAHLCMGSAWNTISGIGVDTHVHRICNLLGWVKTNAPEKTRVSLESWLPREYWREINHMLVGHGQLTCRPIGRRCDECPLSQEGALRCPSAVFNTSSRKKTIRKPLMVKMEEQQDPCRIPVKQSYDARFPSVVKQEQSINIKSEGDVENVAYQSLLPESGLIAGETGTDLDGIVGEQIENLAVEQSPYFEKAIKDEQSHVHSVRKSI